MPKAGQRRDPEGLTDLERKFAIEYLVDLHAVRAYQRASLPRKVSDKTANACSWKMLQREAVQNLVREARDRVIAKTELTVEDTLQALKCMVKLDVRKLVHEDGRPKALREIDDETAGALAGIKVVTTGNAVMGFGEVTEYKFADRNAAVEKAMRYFGLFEKDHRQKTDPIVELIDAIYGSGSRLKVKE
jgi:hypothetical protein